MQFLRTQLTCVMQYLITLQIFNSNIQNKEATGCISVTAEANSCSLLEDFSLHHIQGVELPFLMLHVDGGRIYTPCSGQFSVSIRKRNIHTLQK